MDNNPSPEVLALAREEIKQCDRDAAEKFVRDWDGATSIRGALAALLAQTRMAALEHGLRATIGATRNVADAAARKRIVAWLNDPERWPFGNWHDWYATAIAENEQKTEEHRLGEE